MIRLFALFFAVTLVITACRRDDTSIGSLVNASHDMADLENVAQTVDLEVDAEIQAFTANQDCPTLTWLNPQGTYPNTVTIDYGAEGCVGPHGHIRKGVIEVNMTAPIQQTGAVRTLTFVSFSIDDIHVQGVRTTTNTGLNANNQPTWSRVMTNGKVIWPDGTSATWQNSNNFTMIEGYNDSVPSNNKWQITGTAQGVSKKGNNWTATITTPLIRKHTCPWPVEGVRALTVEDKDLTLDYGYSIGQSGCDRKAELILPNGNTRIISIRF